jgi:hypothetical protein
MSKVFCACVECKHNKKNICKAKEINLRSWNIHTVYEGIKRMEECLTFEKSEEFQKIEQELRKAGVIPNDQ